MTGKVKWFNNKKGYGFLLSEDGTEVFVHYTGITGMEFKTLAEGEPVEYDVVVGKKGMQAVNVKVTE